MDLNGTRAEELLEEPGSRGWRLCGTGVWRSRRPHRRKRV